MGYQGALLTHHPPQYVTACCQGGAVGSREVHPMRLVAEPAKARPQGRYSHHATVAYPTSQKEIRDLYHEVYLLRRLPCSLPCRPQWSEEAIQDILSSLRSHLHRWGHCHAGGGPTGGCHDYPQPIHQPEYQCRFQRREDLHNEALQEAREAHQQVLEAACMLELNIERLSQGVERTQ